MTNLVSGKRARLIEGAKRVVLDRGIESSTLAECAAAAGVPVGNVYYYFKTKDDLIAAVIDAYAREVRAVLDEFDRRGGPRERLRAFVVAATCAPGDSGSACAQGAMCQELAKRGDDFGRQAARMISLTLDWVDQQFRALGCSDARDLAVSLVAGVHGAALLADSFQNRDMLQRQAHRLLTWINLVAPDAGG